MAGLVYLLSLLFRLPGVVESLPLRGNLPDGLDCFVRIVRIGQDHVRSEDLPFLGKRLVLLNLCQWPQVGRCDVRIVRQRNQAWEINPCQSFFLGKKHPFKNRIDCADPVQFGVRGGSG